MDRPVPFDRIGTFTHNFARLEHLDSLGLDLRCQRVLEVGAGYGKLTGFFEAGCCQVLSTEGRQDNINVNLLRHSWRSSRVGQVDLMAPGSHDHFGFFDVVFCYGTLYHTSDPALVLTDLARVCKGLFLLETRVSPVDNGKINLKKESHAIDVSLHQLGCRPARDWIMTELRKHYPYVYITKTQPDYHEFVLGWPASQPDVRAVFVASRTKLESSLLTEFLPMRQERA